MRRKLSDKEFRSNERNLPLQTQIRTLKLNQQFDQLDMWFLLKPLVLEQYTCKTKYYMKCRVVKSTISKPINKPDNNPTKLSEKFNLPNP